MAETRLADVLVPQEQWVDGTIHLSLRLNALFDSGIVQNDPLLTQLSTENVSQFFDVPYLGDLDDTEANVSTDDPADRAVPLKITSVAERALKAMKNQTWSTMDLASALGAAPDPANAIRQRVANYWNRQYDLHVLKMMNGIAAGNVANDAGDMIHDITANPAPNDVVNAAGVIDALYTAGDRSQMFTTMTCHSVIKANLDKQNLITTVSATGPSGSQVQYDTFLGRRLVVSDECDATGGQYKTYFHAPGAIRYGRGRPRVPLAIERDELAGNGEGQEVLANRNHFTFHPVGFRWEHAAVAGRSPTWAELEDATNWSRVVERKRVPMAILISNG